MAISNRSGIDWTKREIDLIVADYFEMLRLEFAGQSYNKAERNRALQELTGRSRSSVEWKYRNISAVLEKLGEPRIRGYAPAVNHQNALLECIERFIDSRGDIVDWSGEQLFALAQESEIFFEPAPNLTPIVEEVTETETLKRLIRKFDPAERDARNRRLGRLGEERILKTEEVRLRDAGRKDLARKVKWVSEIDGDGAGYDILSFTEQGDERLLEVKTTLGYQRTPFYLTENERLVSEDRPHDFRIVRLYDFQRVPKAFELVPPLADSVILRPISYRASFD